MFKVPHNKSKASSSSSEISIYLSGTSFQCLQMHFQLKLTTGYFAIAFFSYSFSFERTITAAFKWKSGGRTNVRWYANLNDYWGDVTETKVRLGTRWARHVDRNAANNWVLRVWDFTGAVLWCGKWVISLLWNEAGISDELHDSVTLPIPEERYNRCLPRNCVQSSVLCNNK